MFLALIILIALTTIPDGRNPINALLKNKIAICQSIIFCSAILHFSNITGIILLNLIPESKASKFIKLSEHYKSIKRVFLNTAKRYLYCILISIAWLFHTPKNNMEIAFLALIVLAFTYSMSGTFQTIWITEKMIELKTEKE